MWRLCCEENPDWEYARNLQLILRTPIAEYSSSAFSAPIQVEGMTYYGGNRDYSWQGLIVGPAAGILYKVIDGVYYSTGSRLMAHDVLYEPGRCTYRYRDEEGTEFRVSVSLADLGSVVGMEAVANRPCWFALPLDLRPADGWIENRYLVSWGRGSMTVENMGVPLRLVIAGFERIRHMDLTLDWRYKLGDGFRQIRDGRVCFSEHRSSVYLPFALYSPGGHLQLQVHGQPGVLPQSPNRAHTRPMPPARFGIGLGKVAHALQLRLETLCSFGTIADGLWFPEAGSWWFRKAWVRDALEGLRWNLKAYVGLLGFSAPVSALVRRLLDLMGSQGGLPLVYGDPAGLSSDSPPILLTVACKLAELLGDRGLGLRAVEAARAICQLLLAGRSVSSSVLEGPIILCPANSSWMDSVIPVGKRRWPTRLPASWIDQGVEPFASQYGLVEVNGLYIEALANVKQWCGVNQVRVPRVVDELFGKLQAGFRTWFKRAETLPPLTVAPPYDLVDATPGSPALVALACLRGSMYSAPELARIWAQAAPELLVHRRLVVLGSQRLPFGVLVRAVERAPYLGDEQYHGPTVWPRDTPYLLMILEAVGGDVAGILLNNLDHMLAEGAFGYCNELFSLPLGPDPAQGSDNPVPVKNPAQYWSHWCDPYLDRLGELGIKS